jgi:hypothetical protein
MTATTEQDELQQIVKAGEQIYAQKYKAQYETNFPDQYAVIDIDTEEAIVGEYAEDAVLNARKRFGSHRQHLIRIGSTSTVQLGSFFPDASLAWAL